MIVVVIDRKGQPLCHIPVKIGNVLMFNDIFFVLMSYYISLIPYFRITWVSIIQMEKEIRELTEQRDLAQSRIEDLLRMVGKEQISRDVIPIS